LVGLSFYRSMGFEFQSRFAKYLYKSLGDLISVNAPQKMRDRECTNITIMFQRLGPIVPPPELV